MSPDELKPSEWFATYHEGDPRLRNKRHGILQLNHEKKRIEFAVQATDTTHSPIILVNYPIEYLQEINIVEKRQRMKKHEYIQLILGEEGNRIQPLFSFTLSDLNEVKKEISDFRNEIISSGMTNFEKSEPDIIEVFSRLLMTPIEQLQNILGEFTSRLREFTLPATKAVLSTLEPNYSYKIQEIELNGRRVRYFSSYQDHHTVLLLISPLGGRIEDYYPLVSSLLGRYQIIILGARGYSDLLEENEKYQLEDYVQDLRDFLDYLGDEKDIVIGAHSLFCAIILDEFLEESYMNVKKIILISGLHRVPETFKKGVKTLPPPQIWAPFKGQVRKIAPKILFTKSTDINIINSYLKNAFTVPDTLYYEIFKDFIIKYDYTKKLQTLNKPLLVIWGKNDRIIHSDLKEEMVNLIPSSILTYKELQGGHMLFLEDPEKVGSEINKFISSNKWSKIEIE